MSTAQATLPLFPTLAGLRSRGRGPGAFSRSGPGTRAALTPAADQTEAVEYRELPVREILNPAGARLPYAWTINPYRGCELACAHCQVRYTHGFLGLDRWRDFETRIFAKRGAAEALTRSLRHRDLRGEPLALGTAADPYQPAEAGLGITRSLLEALAAEGAHGIEGLDLTLITRSPLVLRDLELLAEIDRRHVVTVRFGLVAAEDELARRLEPQGAGAEERLDAVAQLAAQGIATVVDLAPLMPGIGQEAAVLEPLVAGARRAGALDVAAEPLSLPAATRHRFMPWLAQERPRLVPLYRRLYGRRSELRRIDAARLLAAFRRLRLAHGFPRPRPGRG